MNTLMKGTFIYTSGVNEDFVYDEKRFQYRQTDSDTMLYPKTETYSIRTMGSKEHNVLSRRLSFILDRSNITTVDRVELPSDSYTTGKEYFAIIGGDDCFALLGSYGLSDRTELLRRYLSKRDKYFDYLRRRSSDPLSVGQLDIQRMQNSELYIKMLSIYRKLFQSPKNILNEEECYNLLQCLSNISQISYNTEHLNNAEKIVKKYSL